MKLTVEVLQICTLFMSGLLSGTLFHYFRLGIHKRRQEIRAIEEQRREERAYYARARELMEDHYRRANGREPWED